MRRRGSGGGGLFSAVRAARSLGPYLSKSLRPARISEAAQATVVSAEISALMPKVIAPPSLSSAEVSAPDGGGASAPCWFGCGSVALAGWRAARNSWLRNNIVPPTPLAGRPLGGRTLAGHAAVERLSVP